MDNKKNIKPTSDDSKNKLEKQSHTINFYGKVHDIPKSCVAFQDYIKTLSDNINTVNTQQYGDFYSKKIEYLINNLCNYPKHLEKEAALASEIANLRLDITKKSYDISQPSADSVEKEKQISALQNDIKILKEKERLSHLLNRVGDLGKTLIQNDIDFVSKFSDGVPCPAFVLSIDIRRSTELMLKAGDPKLYAQFILDLVKELKQCVLDNFGVFDKFTGDGILGFFPEFYSGKDAGFFAIDTALKCHSIFESHYSSNKNIFNSVLLDTGLGIGLDYGKVHIVDIGGEISVVGAPVVYACRMSGAGPGKTFANHPAFVKLSSEYNTFTFSDESINIKHEGPSLAHNVVNNEKNMNHNILIGVAS